MATLPSTGENQPTQTGAKPKTLATSAEGGDTRQARDPMADRADDHPGENTARLVIDADLAHWATEAGLSKAGLCTLAVNGFQKLRVVKLLEPDDIPAMELSLADRIVLREVLKTPAGPAASSPPTASARSDPPALGATGGSMTSEPRPQVLTDVLASLLQPQADHEAVSSVITDLLGQTSAVLGTRNDAKLISQTLKEQQHDAKSVTEPKTGKCDFDVMNYLPDVINNQIRESIVSTIPGGPQLVLKSDGMKVRRPEMLSPAAWCASNCKILNQLLASNPASVSDYVEYVQRVDAS